jgi:iron(III) transport system ATP-binding protein
MFVAGFMGEANHLKGRLVRKDGPVGTVEIGPVSLTLPHRDLPLGEVDLALRPEAIRIVPPAPPGNIEGRVVRATYMGTAVEYTVACSLGELFVVSPEVGQLWRPGAAIGLMLAERGIALVRP